MTVSKTAPGIPKILTNIMVKKFKPIWKLKSLPIELIISIITQPIKEFRKSLAISFNGNEKILHNTKIMQRPEM